MIAPPVRRGPLWPFLLPPSTQDLPELRAVSAVGHRIRFADGRDRLCATSGLWNVNLGYGNPVIADAVARTLRSASYLTLFRYSHDLAVQAAQALIEVAGADHFGRVLFSTSGGAANDLVMKLARHYHLLRSGQSGRMLVVGLRGSYHGQTLGGFALTGENLGQRHYGVDQRLVRHVTPGDPGELGWLLAREGRQVAAIVVEPVLGSGAVPLGDAFVEELLRLRRQHGFLLVADEVATGFGRTGTFFASQRWAEPPDVLIASKGMTNGTCAAAAVIVSDPVAALFDDSDAVLIHGETQAGSPPSCAAILATVDQMRDLSAVSRAQTLSELLDSHLTALAADREDVLSTDGLGCFRAVRLADVHGKLLPAGEVASVVAAIRDAGAIVHPGVHGIQLVPALTYNPREMDELFGCVRAGLDAYAAHASRPIGVPS